MDRFIGEPGVAAVAVAALTSEPINYSKANSKYHVSSWLRNGGKHCVSRCHRRRYTFFACYFDQRVQRREKKQTHTTGYDFCGSRTWHKGGRSSARFVCRRYDCIIRDIVIIVIIFIFLFSTHTNGFRSRRVVFPQVSGYSGYYIFSFTGSIISYTHNGRGTDDPSPIVRITLSRTTHCRACARTTPPSPLIGIRSVLALGLVFAVRKHHRHHSMHRTRFLSGHGRLRGRWWWWALIIG